ncbi:Putative Atypical/HISK protein kinase [Rhizopus microsporus]|nr:Putative Atypical/HISK protein kinase [Rhizopus microsporus]
MPKPAIKKTIQGIYEATFSEVGDQFLDVLVEEIAILFNVQTVMIHRLLSAKEFRDMKHSEGCPSIQLIKTPNAHLSADEQYLFIKACHSTLPQQPALTKYSAVALSSFPDNSPHIKTLEDVTHYVTQDASLSGTVYPSYSSFVGLRLDLDSREPIGLISIMHDKPLEKQQLDHIACILKAVQRRVTNEISRLRQRDNLIVIKNAALQDAEYKLRFLADMSHEIRTPLNAVVALTDLLLQEKQSLNEEQVEHLQVIQTSGNHLLTVINDILDFSKMNHGSKFKLEYRKFSLRKCIKDALNMARHQAANSQYPKQIHIVECPLEIKDDIPVPQLLQQLEASGILAHKHGTNQQTSLPFIWKVDPDIPDYLMGDSMRLTQILINLCSNAAKFTKQGGIHVKISKPDTDKSNFRERYDARVESVYQKYAMRRRKKAPIVPSSDSSDSCYYYETEDEQTVPQEDQNGRVVLEISVTDTGIGMPASRLPLLFKSFSQIDISTARKYGGTGLGLAISSMLVNRMGGGLWVESEEGVGSRFALTLPIAIAQDIPTSPSSSISSTESLFIIYNIIIYPTPSQQHQDYKA